MLETVLVASLSGRSSAAACVANLVSCVKDPVPRSLISLGMSWATKPIVQSSTDASAKLNRFMFSFLSQGTKALELHFETPALSNRNGEYENEWPMFPGGSAF